MINCLDKQVQGLDQNKQEELNYLFPKTEQDLTSTINKENIDLWSADYFKHQLFLALTCVKEIIIENGHEISVRKYYRIAENLIYQIPITQPVVEFPIFLSDLPPNIILELHNRKKTSYTSVFNNMILDAVGMLFENVNFSYYHISIRKYLKVKFYK